MNFKYILYYYLLGINIFSFLIFFIDKRKAIKNSYRISEAFLFLLSVLGGSLGSLLAMKVFHHKTRKMKFTLGLPLIFILHLSFMFYMDLF